MQQPIYYSRNEYIETVRIECRAGCNLGLICLKCMMSHIAFTHTAWLPQDTGNKVSRKAIIAGPQNIILGGKTIISNGAIIRGDLRRTGSGHTVVISLGRYCLIGEGCIMRYVDRRRRHWNSRFMLMATTFSYRPAALSEWGGDVLQATVQDIPREFQLLPHEDRGPRSHRGRDCR